MKVKKGWYALKTWIIYPIIYIDIRMHLLVVGHKTVYVDGFFDVLRLCEVTVHCLEDETLI